MALPALGGFQSPCLFGRQGRSGAGVASFAPSAGEANSRAAPAPTFGSSQLGRGREWRARLRQTAGDGDARHRIAVRSGHEQRPRATVKHVPASHRWAFTRKPSSACPGASDRSGRVIPRLRAGGDACRDLLRPGGECYRSYSCNTAESLCRTLPKAKREERSRVWLRAAPHDLLPSVADRVGCKTQRPVHVHHHDARPRAASMAARSRTVGSFPGAPPRVGARTAQRD